MKLEFVPIQTKDYKLPEDLIKNLDDLMRAATGLTDYWTYRRNDLSGFYNGE